MTATSFRSLVVTAVALFALGLAGCGGGASNEAPPAAEPPPAEPPPAAEAPPAEPPPVAEPAAAAPAGNAQGAELFATYCSSCHGAAGAGDGVVAGSLNPKPASFVDASFWDGEHNGHKHDDAQLKLVIEKGGAAAGLSPLMAPWNTVVDTPEKMDAILAHLKSLRQG